jgi:endonuclease YncB( thermonuclease family)
MKRLISKFKKSNKEQDTSLFTLNGLETKVTFHSNYDGDTLKLIIPFCCKQFIFNCRLIGLDTPEIRGSSDNEKLIAKEVKEFVLRKCTENELWARCYKFDKYGRVLCDVYFSQNDLHADHHSLSELLLQNGYAYKYDGGHKLSFEEWYKPTK